MKYRIYDSKSGEFIPKSVLCLSAIAPDGELGVFDSNGNFVNRSGRYKISWFTGWTDRKGNEVYEGDVLKRVRDVSAEWIKEGENAPEVDAESFVTDYSGGLGLVQWKPGGFTIDHLEGHKWAFHGPEGALNASWSEELEVIGNEFQNPELL